MRNESYPADTAGWNSHYDIVSFHLGPVLPPHETMVLVLDDIRYIEVELDLSSLCFDLLSQVYAHMLGA